MFGASVAGVFVWFIFNDGHISQVSERTRSWKLIRVFKSRTASGSEVDPFNQRCLQGHNKLVEGLENPTEGVNGCTVPQQSSVLVRPRGQRTLCQQGEPLGQKSVPVDRNNRQLAEYTTTSNLTFN